MARSRTLISTAQGTHQQAFGPTEWGLLAFIAGVWGSSFLLIAIGLDDFAPGVVTFGRILFGMLGLAFVPGARVPIEREDWPKVALIGFTWMALPLSLFPIAELYVDSSVAGMINGAVPLFAAFFASVLLATRPHRRQAIGLTIGFLGVVAISLPSLHGAEASPVGIGLLVVAVVLYGLSTNLAVPLQQKYGGLAFMWRVQVCALVMTAPYGLASVPASEFGWASLVAVMVLGFLGTGWAFVAMTNLMGRAGAARGSVAIYVTPVVAIALGVVFRDETVAGLALVGTVLVLLGAWLTSRADG
ncbi:MAG TPA: DMT family transporter [Acidimicrobiales bacterium]